jgi:hypothetical protein
MESNIPQFLNFSETPFENLMQRRIHKVLIVCSDYDSFNLEEDGRIEEQIFNEYVSLNLRYPPSIINVNTSEQALKLMAQTNIDLVITMLNVGDDLDTFMFAKKVKNDHPGKPVVILTPFSDEIANLLNKSDLSGVDYVFSWLGSADILLAIIKLMEDEMNVEIDTEAGVQIILLVEDSRRYYSGYLTNMYKILLVQSKKFMKEGLNENQQMQRMRGRPKIMLAQNYEEAVRIYRKYKNNMLGIVSDTKYPRKGVLDPKAGIRFLKQVKKENKYLPCLLQSSDKENEFKANEIKVGFIYKYSENLPYELKRFMNKYFAFGAFEFINPNNDEVLVRTHNLKDLQDSIFNIPDDSFEYHITLNHISKWLYARALFPLADFFASVSKSDFGNDLHKIKQFVYENIKNFRSFRSRGIIAEFNRDFYDSTYIFARIGKGYMGGKARGLAFLDSLIKKHPELQKYQDVMIKIPRTVVLTTEIFDRFMEENNLYPFALSHSDNQDILNKFITGVLPEDTKHDLRAFLHTVSNPIAVRSSSVLEDSYYQPFAGVYATYMLSNAGDFETNFYQLTTAIKSVYASVFYKETKTYMKATKNFIDEEKMAVVLQEVCGNKFYGRFYPTFSGVARSVNFYPLENEKPNDGIVNVALGLGKYIVEGKRSLRFSPGHPKKILQLSSPEEALKSTQKTFFALKLDPESFTPSTDDCINYELLNIQQAEVDESIYDISSVYDFHDNVLKEGKMYKGKRLITFANILKYNMFPLAEILRDVLSVSEKAMNNPVEIEFAVNMSPKNTLYKFFNLLQIRPIVEDTADDDINLLEVKNEDTIITSMTSLGHGMIRNIQDFVYIKPESFDSLNNKKIVPIIEKINQKFLDDNKHYILCGPGRWGSSDHWLGIPVVWSQISAAKLIIEAGLKDFQVEPSQGTHFFQNLTSFKVGYFTINPFKNDGYWDLDYLKEMKPVYEDDYVRHIRFEKELVIKIDAKHSKGVILKPDYEKRN